MAKKLVIGVLVIALAVLGLECFQFWGDDGYGKPLSRKDLVKESAAVSARSGQTGLPTPVALTPLKMSHHVRLAIGGLGPADHERNRELGDLVTVSLTGTPGFDLVERESLAAILRELNLSWSGLVRARDAMRVGKILKAEWFLLGTETKINDTNCIVARVVDARTGVIRDAGVFPADKPAQQLASDLASFLRQVRQNAATAKVHVCLGIGAFEDFSVNGRRADFPSQLRDYLTAAYRGSDITLLERESVETLLQEMHLDLAGLTEDAQNPPAAMQSAFWLVTGQYQSYETTNFQVEVNLDVHRVFGTTWHKSVRGNPGESVGMQCKQAIDEVMNQNDAVNMPTRRSEARLQLQAGRELCTFNKGAGGIDLVWAGGLWKDEWRMDSLLAARQLRNLQEAMRAFQTVLLLEATNHEAKMYLAACLRSPRIFRLDEACGYYREIIDDPVQDRWTEPAEQALETTFLYYTPNDQVRWYQAAIRQTTNDIAAAYYRKQAEAAGKKAIIDAGDSPKAEELAEQRLFEEIQSANDYFHNKIGAHLQDHLGMRDYVAAVGGNGSNGARKLAGLLPKMEQAAPDLRAYLVTSVLSFQPDTNTPVAGEFQTVLADSVEHPRLDLNPGQLWADMGEIYYWCFEKTNYPLAAQLMEDRRTAAAKHITDFDDEEKIKLAYAYLMVERWKDALDIFECYSNRPFPAQNGGPWGEAFQPILTDKLVAYCRTKLGQTVQQDSRRFEMGKPVLCLCAPSTFAADDNGLWIGISGHLLNLDFELKTNLDVELPVNKSLPVTALCTTATDVWIGTAGGGLVRFDKASHRSQCFTESDGLLMNYLSSLQPDANSLWLGYGSATGGGLGQMNLKTGKISSFTPGLSTGLSTRMETEPPREKVEAIVTRDDGSLQLLAGGNVSQFIVSSNVWETPPVQSSDWIRDISGNANYFVESSGKKLVVLSLRENRPQQFEDAAAIPASTTTLTLDGNDLWVGGEGAIAVVDLRGFKARKYAYIQAGAVDRIQIGGGYIWAQFDSHLYRAPLSALQ